MPPRKAERPLPGGRTREFAIPQPQERKLKEMIPPHELEVYRVVAFIRGRDGKWRGHRASHCHASYSNAWSELRRVLMLHALTRQSAAGAVINRAGEILMSARSADGEVVVTKGATRVRKAAS